MPKVTIDDVRSALDYGEAERAVVSFLREYVEAAGVRGFVVGLSGGVDSSTAAALAVKALGSSRVVGLIMPDPTSTPPGDVEDAKSLAERLGIKYFLVPIDRFLESYKGLPFYEPGDRVAFGNIKARVRMTILYYYANLNGLLVLGTGDKSELLLGYYTKYGDGGVDVLPLGDLYKTQVRVMARRVGVPERIASKPSSPRLWPGQTAEGELGLSYETIDVVLYSYFDLRVKPEDIPAATGVGIEVVRRILERVRKTEHKRRTPPIVRVSRRTLGHDIRLPLHR